MTLLFQSLTHVTYKSGLEDSMLLTEETYDDVLLSAQKMVHSIYDTT